MCETITQAVKENTKMAIKTFIKHLTREKTMGPRIEAATEVVRAKKKLDAAKSE
ncbi:hypothetical protein ACHAQK_009870, partial [Fusarium lateritium]